MSFWPFMEYFATWSWLKGTCTKPLKMLEESEPVPLFMPMIIGCGPSPEGMLNFDVIVIVLPPSLTVTVRVPPL